jgi:hypothetical protein
MNIQFFSHIGQPMNADKIAYSFLNDKGFNVEFVASNTPKMVIDGVDKVCGYASIAQYMFRLKKKLCSGKFGASEAVKIVDQEVDAINLRK